MKRLTGAFLALMLLCALFTPCLAADAEADFTDQAAIRNDDAVQMLVDLGLIAGFEDGSFHPEENITREQVAKLIAILCTEDPGNENYVKFYDCYDSWAKNYIAYCSGRGIVSGDGYRFRPKDPVTARELAKMLLVVLGGDYGRYVGAQWAENVDTDALDTGIYAGLSAAAEEPVSRDNACLLIYNAMRSYAVADPHAEDAMQRYVLDDLMNPKTYLEVRYDVAHYTAVLTGNECANLAGGGKLEKGKTKLAGHKEFDVTTDLALVGRSVDIYMRDGEIVGVPCASTSELYYVFSSAAELEEICQDGTFSVTGDTEYYLNYSRNTLDSVRSVSADGRIIVIDHDGDFRFDTVFVLSGERAAVTAVSPLTVSIDERQTAVQAYDSSDCFAEGQNVLLFYVGGNAYIRPIE